MRLGQEVDEEDIAEVHAAGERPGTGPGSSWHSAPAVIARFRST